MLTSLFYYLEIDKNTDIQYKHTDIDVRLCTADVTVQPGDL